MAVNKPGSNNKRFTIFHIYIYTTIIVAIQYVFEAIYRNKTIP